MFQEITEYDKFFVPGMKKNRKQYNRKNECRCRNLKKMGSKNYGQVNENSDIGNKNMSLPLIILV